MQENSKLKDYLLNNGTLSEEEFLQAEDYALTRSISLEQSLIFLNLLSFSALGHALAEIANMVYHPLLNSAPSDSAISHLPLKFADQWKIFPISYDSEKALLTLACTAPDNEILSSKLKAVLPPTTQLDFTIATGSEIERAIDVYYRGKSFKQNIALDLPQDFKILIPAKDSEASLSLEAMRTKETRVILIEPDVKRAGAFKTILKGEGYTNVEWIASPGELPKVLRDQSVDRLLINGQSYPAMGSWMSTIPESIELPRASYYNPTVLVEGQGFPYPAMSESLIGMAAAFVRKNFEQTPHYIQEVLARVRYCKLLALKLDLFQTQMDGVVLAAWLSAFEKEPDLLKLIETPFKLGEIFCPQRRKKKEAIRIEAAILKLVIHYQSLKRSNPRVYEDLDRLRGILIKGLPSSGCEPYLEVFLNLVKNEEFLKGIDKPAGRILIVDPSQSPTSPSVIRLNNDGFEINVVPDGKKALKQIAEHKYDLIISEAKLPDTDGLKFCRLIKSNQSTVNIPFFIFTEEDDNRLPVESLEAGADDFIKKPGELEILSLKVRKVIEKASSQDTNGGVSGSLSEMSPTDFIQSLSAGEKSVRITIANETESGQIYIEKGNIIHAQTGDIEGDKAFYKIVVWEEGRFQILPWSTFPSSTIQGNTLSLLLEASRLADEAMGIDDDET
ncbi:MAG: response regulator [Desulfobacterales bacterium]|jgi:DNA-binding response OmpR family regulator